MVFIDVFMVSWGSWSTNFLGFTVYRWFILFYRCVYHFWSHSQIWSLQVEHRKLRSPCHACVWRVSFSFDITWGPRGGWTKAKVYEHGNTMGFWWELDMLNTDCLETWQDLSPWPSAYKIAPKMPRELRGGFRVKNHCVGLRPAPPLAEARVTPASYR